ncbi:hypothetical protein M427DRAFT_56003 [Gonapodya prolifera JEL478]|uniref:Peptidyl-tRNA hydrolase n=1 Tax=Gonapodya prolifera (strain JEL478) TaxID=1344416 RepID=A0A139AH94_GONPJ|nr:hypothetical protein M427DRAFT_56003 [Gonapodya prolifera JEL478]|eukprot:KXS16108.1 hypothetical protein M427DRAFT_56003 [Gonapodya prolifera JEL478]
MSSLPVDFFIIGLGNPDPQYAISRHNVGYVFCNFLANAISMSQAPEGAAAVPVFWRRVDVMVFS